VYGFEQASAIWMAVQPSVPQASAQSNWMAAAAEARQLADELLKNVQTLLSYWQGPAATEFSKSMQTLAGFAADLSSDMTNMANGLSQMAATAEASRAQAMTIIATHQYPSYLRAAGAAQLNALMGTTGAQYNSAKSQYWQEPTQPPEKLPHKNGSTGETTPGGLDNPGTIPPKKDIKDDFDLLDIIKPIADGLGFSDTDGPGGGDGDLDNFNPGPLPDGSLPPDDPSYNPVPIPDTNLEEPDPIGGGGMTPVGGSTGLAGATPTVPTTGLATTGGGMAPVGGGVPPMGGVMGAGGFAAPRAGGGAPKGAGAMGGAGGGLFGPPMMGGGAGRRGEDEESGVHTWLTEDEMAWDGDAAPGAVTGRD